MRSERAIAIQPGEAPHPTRLSSRLKEIVSSVPRCDRVIDVGSDHGHVISYLLENHITSRAIATDIHADPAETTQRYLRRQGVMQLAEVYHTDGLHGIELQERDVVIIAGLGGLEMIRILSEALKEHEGVFPEGVHWILQPQRSSEELRGYLLEGCFRIDREVICRDRNRYYVIIHAERIGVSSRKLTLTERVLGPHFLENRPVFWEEYLVHQKNVLKKQMRARPELAGVLADIDAILQGKSMREKVQS